MKVNRGAVIALIVVVVAVAGWWSYRVEPQRAKERALAYIGTELKDPSTAVFRYLNVRGDYVCGEVNAKGADGAYAGFRPFWAAADGSGGQVQPGDDLRGLPSEGAALRQMNLDSFHLLYRIHCAP